MSGVWRLFISSVGCAAPRCAAALSRASAFATSMQQRSPTWFDQATQPPGGSVKSQPNCTRVDTPWKSRGQVDAVSPRVDQLDQGRDVPTAAQTLCVGVQDLARSSWPLRDDRMSLDILPHIVIGGIREECPHPQLTVPGISGKALSAA